MDLANFSPIHSKELVPHRDLAAGLCRPSCSDFLHIHWSRRLGPIHPARVVCTRANTKVFIDGVYGFEKIIGVVYGFEKKVSVKKKSLETTARRHKNINKKSNQNPAL